MLRLAPRGAATAPHRTPTFGSAAALHPTSDHSHTKVPDLAGCRIVWGNESAVHEKNVMEQDRIQYERMTYKDYHYDSPASSSPRELAPLGPYLEFTPYIQA